MRRRKADKDPVIRLLSPEGAALGQSGLATGRLAEDCRAAGADDYRLCVGEDGGDGEAAGALHIHEERSGSRDEGLSGIGSAFAGFPRSKWFDLMADSYLELVLASLSRGGRVEEVNCENLIRTAPR